MRLVENGATKCTHTTRRQEKVRRWTDRLADTNVLKGEKMTQNEAEAIAIAVLRKRKTRIRSGPI
jgi:hypothetical protein